MKVFGSNLMSILKLEWGEKLPEASSFRSFILSPPQMRKLLSQRKVD
jgi:hypothetical protein